MSTQLEILVTQGPLKGRRFSVPADGLRLGRSSSCEMSIPDPALSRNHCLFETRDDGLWVTDLASANGTIVNEAQLGPDSQRLQLGDVVFVGDSALQVVAAEGKTPDRAPAPAADPALPVIDLGLGGGASSLGGASEVVRPEGDSKSSWARYALWGVALLSVLAAAALIVLPVAPEAESPIIEDAASSDVGELVSFSFEKVKADSRAVYRYALIFDGKSLHVEVDDVPESRRHVRESAELSDDARARLAEILSSPKLYRLDPEYVGNPSEPGALTGYALHVICGRRVLDVSVENVSEPEALQDARMKLEAFADSELNLHAIHMPVAKLRELSADARRVADAKWAERESKFGNLAEALRKYDAALNYLKTVDPKPADYEETRARRAIVKKELDRVYMLHRGNADQAIGTQNWEQAKYELQVLLELVDDQGDERNKEASRKLLEVEARMKARR